MRANLLSLQNTGKLLDQTQLRLATGNKVNSALDNPVNFFAAQSLNQRASSLSALLDGMGQAIQTIQSVNQALTSITSLVKQLTSIANTAKTNLNNTTTQNILGTISATGLDSNIVADLTYATGGITADEAFTLQNASGAVHTFTITAGMTLNELVDSINEVDGFQASVVYGDGTKTYNDTATTTDTMGVGGAYLKIVSSAGEAITAADVGSGAALSVLGLDTSSLAVTTGGITNDITSFNDVLDNIDQLVTDSNYQGNNLLDGLSNDLTVQVNELSTGAITVTSKNATAAGIGLNDAAWTDATDINASIDEINTALSNLQAIASSFSNTLSLIQNRQDFTSNIVNNLQDGATRLTIADKNEEGANLLALQTQQQLGIQALSLSSQANQSVLRLFS